MTSSGRNSDLALRSACVAVAALLTCGCFASAPKAKPQPAEPGSRLYRADAIRAHDAAVAVLAEMGEHVEEDRGDGQYLQTISEERPDRTRIRTHVSISPQQAAGTRVTVRRGVVKTQHGQEVEWTALPLLPAAGDEVQDAIARQLQETGR